MQILILKSRREYLSPAIYLRIFILLSYNFFFIIYCKIILLKSSLIRLASLMEIKETFHDIFKIWLSVYR